MSSFILVHTYLLITLHLYFKLKVILVLHVRVLKLNRKILFFMYFDFKEVFQF